jgi:hypothetical protein
VASRDEALVGLTEHLHEAQVQHDPRRPAERRRQHLVIRESDEARDEDNRGADARR